MQSFESFPPRRFVAGAVALFLLAEAAVVIVNLSPLIDYWGPRKLFDVNGEGTIPVWLSSAALLMIAVGALVCGAVEAAARTARHRSLGWVAFAGMFAFLSLDETASMHELVGKYTAIHLGSFESLPGVFTWIVVLVPVALTAAGALVFWFARTIGWRESSAKLSLAAIAVWMAVPVLEAFDPILGAPRWLIILEESTEVLGEALMLSGVWMQALALQSRHLVTIRVLGKGAMGQPIGAGLEAEQQSSVVQLPSVGVDSSRRKASGLRAA